MTAPSSGGASRDGYGTALLNLASDPRVVVIEADLGKSTKSCLFREKYPERTISLGNCRAKYGTRSGRFSVLWQSTLC